MKKTRAKIPLKKSDFRVGFELEFKSKVLRKKYGDPCRFCDWDSPRRKRIKLPDKSFERLGEVGADGPHWELRTRPICYSKAKARLLKAFHLLDYFEAASSKRCGLHINVSCKKRTLHQNLDPIRLTEKLDPVKLTRLFGRRNLETCASPPESSPFSVFTFYTSKFAAEDRHMSINLMSYGENPKKTSRVEFRFPGGKDYHRKPELCCWVLDRIVGCMAKSYRT